MEKAFSLLDAPVVRIGVPNTPVPACPTLEGFYISHATESYRGSSICAAPLIPPE